MDFSPISDRSQNNEDRGIQTSKYDVFDQDGRRQDDVNVPDPGSAQDGEDVGKTTRGVVKDSKYAWIKCFASFTIQVIIVGVLHCFGVFFVEFTREFQTTKSAAAWAGSLAYGTTMMLGPLATAVILKIGVRGSIVLGSLLCALSMLISSAMTSMTWLYLSFSLLYGIGCCLAYLPTMTIAEDYFSKYLSVATGITVSGSSVGTLILNPASQAMVDSIGWRSTFKVLAGCCCIGAVCGLAFEGPPPATTPARMVRKSPLRRLVADLHLWKNKVYIVWVAGLTLVMFGYYIPYVHLVSHAIELGIPARQGSIIIMLLGASTASGRILFGKIITFGILDRLHMHQLSIVITGMACMLLPLIKTLGGLLAYVVCAGLVDGCFVVMMPLLTVTLAGVENKVNAWGYVVCFTGITFTLGPPVAGWIFDATGSYNLAFHIAGIPILLGAAVMFFIPWAQRTGSRMNDALSTAGDIDYVTASQSMYSTSESLATHDSISRMSATGSVMSMWAAPSHVQPSLRGSRRSSFRGSAFSLDQKGPLDNLRDRSSVQGNSPGIELHDINVSMPTSAGPIVSPRTDVAQGKGRRTRSLSESSNGRDQRGVQWVDQVDYNSKVRPTLVSDPTTDHTAEHRTPNLRRDQTTKSDQDMLKMCQTTVEVRDDIMGIFMETIMTRHPQALVHTAPINTNLVSQSGTSSPSTPPPSVGQSGMGSDLNKARWSQNTSPIAIISTQQVSPPPTPSPQMWTSPLGSPQTTPVHFVNSPPCATTATQFDSTSQAIPVAPTLDSPKLSGHLLTIPEGQLIPNNVQQIEAMLQNSNNIQQQQAAFQPSRPVPDTNAATQTSIMNIPPNENMRLGTTKQDDFTHYTSPDNTQPFQPYHSGNPTNPFLQNKSDVSLDNDTTNSSVSLNDSPLSSNTLVSPDAQVLFPMDSMSAEKNTTDKDNT